MPQRALRSVLTVWIFLGSLGGMSQAETLADALVSAYNQSGLIEQNRALLRAADEDVAQALQRLRPVLSFAAGSNYNSDRGINGGSLSDASLTLQWTVFDGGSTSLRREGLQELVFATRADLMEVEQSVLINAVRAFMEVIKQEQTVVLRKNNLTLINEELRAVQDRFEVGEVTRTDVALATARLASARASLASAEGALLQAQANYVELIGREPKDLAEPDFRPKIPQAEGEALAIARASHPSIVSNRHRIAAAELNVQAARAGLGPSVNLFGSYTIDDDREENNTVGLTLNQTIYRGGELRSVVRQSIANAESARAQMAITQKALVADVTTSYANLKIVRATRLASEEEVSAATLAFEGVREEAALGARTTLDVLDAEQELLDAQVRFVSATADEVVALFTVLDTIGKLTAQELGLPVKIYDPTAYYSSVERGALSLTPEDSTLDRVIEPLGETK